MVHAFRKYLELARGDPQVIGVDMFLWADVPPGQGSFRGVTSFPVLRQAILADAPPYRRRSGNCPESTVPRGPFRSMTAGVMSGFFSTGTAYCSFSDEETWKRWWNGHIRSAAFRMLPRIPRSLAYAGRCLEQ